MEKGLVLLMLVVSVSLAEAAGCVPTTSPQCYKNSTNKDEDFICNWEELNPEQNPTYIFYIWDIEKKSYIMRANSGRRTQRYLVLEELGTISRKMDIGVERNVGNLRCNSDKTTVILECLVKYIAPNITSMKRLAGTLNLTLEKPIDLKGVKYEIRWRERDSEWETKEFETQDSTDQDFYSLQLQNQTVYQVQLRRKAKQLLHPCHDSLQALWSDWSPTVDVPLEIRLPPVIRCKEEQRYNSRDVSLTWDAPPPEESVGGVKYSLTLSIWPCENPKRIKPMTVNQLSTSITFSEAWVSITAINSVGSSPTQKITIPAVKHLDYCTTRQKKDIKAKNTCLEWYKLEDGKTRPTAVNSSRNNTFTDIEKEVEKHVRHYYYFHIKSKKHYQTHARCPFYSEEGAPIKGPTNVRVFNVTYESAVVSWLSIPVVEQRGFIQQYVIWISGEGNTTRHPVPANETSFFIGNLHPGVSYSISIAGRTRGGQGPNSTVNFETQTRKMGLSWQDQTIMSVCVVALLCTLICSVAARRFRSKLLPVVPIPVISATQFICPHDQVTKDMSHITEEVHEVTLLELQKLSKSRETVTPEQSTLLQDFGLVVFEEDEDEEEEGGRGDLRSMKSCCYPNPSYKGQTLQLSEPFHMTDSTYKDTESTYRNGLFIETAIIECDETSL